MRRNEEIASHIAALLLDDDGLEGIEARLGGFNLFEAIGHTRTEARHSDFLAFLLDPNGSHGLGTEFLGRFAVAAVRSMPTGSRPLSLSEVALADFDDCLVLREHHRIDVLCIDETRRFLLAIENKVGTGEHSGQLGRYRSYLDGHYSEFRRILAYLTPDGEEPSDDAWTAISYREVLSMVETVVAKRGASLGDAVTVALEHYARMLRRNIVTDNELAEIAKRVYRKHKDALDFIFEQRPDAQLERSEFIADLLSGDGRIEDVHRTKSLIRFFPVAWTTIRAFNSTPMNDWTKTGRSLAFEVQNATDAVRMIIVIGPADDGSVRREILDCAHRNAELFPGARPSLSPRFTQIYSRALVGRETLNSQPEESVIGRLENGLRGFLDQEFERIVDTLAEAFRDNED